MKTVNSMVPLWQRKKSDVTDEEYNKFYSELTHEFDKPQRTITVSAEGSVTYKALLFVPSSRPFNFYTEGYEKGLQLYSAGVLIMDKCDSLLPDYLRFVRGVVDSPDLSLYSTTASSRSSARTSKRRSAPTLKNSSRKTARAMRNSTKTSAVRSATAS